MRPWEVLHTRYLLKRWWMNLRVDHVRLPDGTELEEFHVIEYPNWACVLCLTEAGQVVMVEQYRHGVGRASLELPAGVIEAGEDPLTAARRELLEETGYAADSWTLLGPCTPEPSKHTNAAYLFVARAARPVEPQRLDESEAIAVRLFDPSEVLRLADTGKVAHGIHLAAIFWAAHRGFLEDLPGHGP